jgi:D-alanine-D-alanine ligase
MPPRVLVLFNEPTLPADHPDADSEHDILYTADGIAKILHQAGLMVERLGIVDDPKILIEGLRASKPDIVFNLYEGLAQWGNTEAYVSGLLEMLRISFTGSPTQPLLLCRSKPLTKQLLAGAGLPTAAFMTLTEGPIPECTVPWPVIVKPGREDASVGIDQASVCTDQAQLEARVEYLRKTYGPSVLVEQFIRGREFNVAVVEHHGVLSTLPFSEILFVPPADKPHLWPIVSFDAKWHPGTTDFTATPAINPAVIDDELHEKIATLAKAAFELVGCRDYARVDFRVDESGQPYILEVNPNPCISPLAGLAAGLETAKVPYHEFILGLVDQALSRAGKKPWKRDTNAEHDATVIPHHAKQKSDGVLRIATLLDHEAITALLSGKDIPATWLNKFQATQSSFQRVYVLEDAENIVGVALAELHDTAHGTATLSAVVVKPTERNLGHARKLLMEVEQHLAGEGFRLLIAHVSSGPLDAGYRRFLQSVELRSIGELAEYYKDGYSRLTYARTLTPVPAAVPQAATV